MIQIISVLLILLALTINITNSVKTCGSDKCGSKDDLPKCIKCPGNNEVPEACFAEEVGTCCGCKDDGTCWGCFGTDTCDQPGQKSTGTCSTQQPIVPDEVLLEFILLRSDLTPAEQEQLELDFENTLTPPIPSALLQLRTINHTMYNNMSALLFRLSLNDPGIQFDVTPRTYANLLKSAYENLMSVLWLGQITKDLAKDYVVEIIIATPTAPPPPTNPPLMQATMNIKVDGTTGLSEMELIDAARQDIATALGIPKALVKVDVVSSGGSSELKVTFLPGGSEDPETLANSLKTQIEDPGMNSGIYSGALTSQLDSSFPVTVDVGPIPIPPTGAPLPDPVAVKIRITDLAAKDLNEQTFLDNIATALEIDPNRLKIKVIEEDGDGTIVEFVILPDPNDPSSIPKDLAEDLVAQVLEADSQLKKGEITKNTDSTYTPPIVPQSSPPPTPMPSTAIRFRLTTPPPSLVETLVNDIANALDINPGRITIISQTPDGAGGNLVNFEIAPPVIAGEKSVEDAVQDFKDQASDTTKSAPLYSGTVTSNTDADFGAQEVLPPATSTNPPSSGTKLQVFGFVVFTLVAVTVFF